MALGILSLYLPEHFPRSRNVNDNLSQGLGSNKQRTMLAMTASAKSGIKRLFADTFSKACTANPQTTRRYPGN